MRRYKACIQVDLLLHVQVFFTEYFVGLEGCEKFVSIDGIWKLRHRHCLYPVKAEVAGLPTINYPNVCTEEPETQASVFCAEHSELAMEKNIPTNLREFIHDYCKVPRNHDPIYATIHSIYFLIHVTICMIHAACLKCMCPYFAIIEVQQVRIPRFRSILRNCKRL